MIFLMRTDSESESDRSAPILILFSSFVSIFRYRNDASFCTQHQSLLHPHLDSLFDRVYKNYRSS